MKIMANGVSAVCLGGAIDTFGIAALISDAPDDRTLLQSKFCPPLVDGWDT